MAENIKPYWSVISAYAIHRISLRHRINHPHMVFRPTKNMPATPITANIHDHIIGTYFLHNPIPGLSSHILDMRHLWSNSM